MHIQGRQGSGWASRAVKELRTTGTYKKQKKSLQLMFVSVQQQC